MEKSLVIRNFVLIIQGLHPLAVFTCLSALSSNIYLQSYNHKPDVVLYMYKVYVYVFCFLQFVFCV